MGERVMKELVSSLSSNTVLEVLIASARPAILESIRMSESAVGAFMRWNSMAALVLAIFLLGRELSKLEKRAKDKSSLNMNRDIAAFCDD
jgi:hypothetical protein